MREKKISNSLHNKSIIKSIDAEIGIKNPSQSSNRNKQKLIGQMEI